MVRSRPMLYLAAGGLNTLFGYFVGVAMYFLLTPRFHIIVIGALANVLAISFSFASYKLIVFRTRGNWLVEYLRSYVVYGGIALVGIALLWIFVDALRLPIWVAQGLAVGITAVISYAGHSRYTFRLAQDAETGPPK